MSKFYHNIGILAHVDSGKTTLTEQLLYVTGALRTVGSVDSGTTATDNLSIERARGISVRTSTASTEWQGCVINIIDTPGHVDFAGEVERSLSALDYAIVVVSAADGVKAHTENILHALDSMKLPALVFINKADRAGAEIDPILRDIRKLTGKVCVLLSKAENIGCDKVRVSTLEDGEFDRAVTEALADYNDEAAEAFLNDSALDHTKSCAFLDMGIATGKVMPVLTGSAKLGAGVRELADFIVRHMPSSVYKATDELSGVIFKIEHDKSIGKISHIRLFGGRIENRDRVTLVTPDDPKRKNPEGEENDAVEIENEAPPAEKVSQIRKFTGGRYSDSGVVEGGDIAALCGLPSAKAGQYVGSHAISDAYRLVTPYMRVRVTPTDADPESIPKLAAALAELSEEEPYIDSKWENGQRDIVISTTGKIQTEIIDSMLKERYGITAAFSDPAVIYKETPAKAGIAYADYTMPKPCWAVVKFMFEPMPRGYGVSYHGKLPSNQCFYRYQTHIRRSFYECLEQGLYGWEVTDFKCTLIGGEHHTIHTHPLDFFVCTPMAFMNGMASLGSVILEPLLKTRISLPTEISGKVTGEIARMRGEYDIPVFFGDTTVIEAIVPVATSMDLPTKLASWSSGRALISHSFYGYRECPAGEEHINPRRGINPLDRSKWILWARGAITLSDKD